MSILLICSLLFGILLTHLIIYKKRKQLYTRRNVRDMDVKDEQNVLKNDQSVDITDAHIYTIYMNKMERSSTGIDELTIALAHLEGLTLYRDIRDKKIDHVIVDSVCYMLEKEKYAVKVDELEGERVMIISLSNPCELLIKRNEARTFSSGGVFVIGFKG